MIAQNPDLRVRDIAAVAQITEGSTQRIVADLEAAGYVSHERNGRRNHYRIQPTETLRHPKEQGIEIGSLLDVFADCSGNNADDKAALTDLKPRRSIDTQCHAPSSGRVSPVGGGYWPRASSLPLHGLQRCLRSALLQDQPTTTQRPR